MFQIISLLFLILKVCHPDFSAQQLHEEKKYCHIYLIKKGSKR